MKYIYRVFLSAIGQLIMLHSDNLGQFKHTQEMCGDFSLLSFLPPETSNTKGPLLKKCVLLRIYSFKGGSSIITAVQRSIITPELSLLSLVTLQCSNATIRKSYGDQDREIYNGRASHDELLLCLGLFVGT